MGGSELETAVGVYDLARTGRVHARFQVGEICKRDNVLSQLLPFHVIAYAARRKEAPVDHPLTLEGIQDSLTHALAPRVRQRMDRSLVILKGAPTGTTRD